MHHIHRDCCWNHFTGLLSHLETKAKRPHHFDNLEYTLSTNVTKSDQERALKISNIENSNDGYEEPIRCAQPENYYSLGPSHFESVDDPLYEEITQKIVISDGEYDELDHSRPEQKLHPFYQRIPLEHVVI